MARRPLAARALVAVAAFALLASGCSRDPDGTAAPGTTGGTAPATTPATNSWGVPGTRPDDTPATSRPRRPPATTAPGAVGAIEWEPCGKSECGTLTVPLDHADPEGRTVDLAVARKPATDPDRRIGSLFINPGGPGASGVGYLRGSPAPAALNERFDLVSWDPRGVGDSNPVPCGDEAKAFRDLDWDPDDQAEQDRLDALAEEIASSCGAADLDLLRHLGTDDVARDLDLLRAAVGDDKLTYLGYSYGTLIGQRYAALFPERIRAMVLDGVVDPTEDLPTMLRGQTVGLDALVQRLFADCEQDPACPLDDPSGTYDRLAERLEEQPITGANGRVVLGPTTLAYATISSSYEASMHAMYLRGLAAADRGDGTLLRTLADAYWTAGDYPAYLAVLCGDEDHPVGADDFEAFADELEEVSPRFGKAVANEMLPCATWPIPSKRDTEAVRADGAPAILVVGNTGDVATPYASAEKVAGQLRSGVLLTYEGEGHTSYGKDRCVDRAVEAYLLDLDVPAAGTRCG